MISIKMVQEAKKMLFGEMGKSGLSWIGDVKITDICFDDYYRNEDMRHTKDLVTNYKEGVWDYPRVNHRDGKIFCFSGRHRISAAEKMGETMVKCINFKNQTKEWEIDKYRSSDKFQKRHSQKDDFKAALVAKDKDAQFIEDIVSGHGFSILGGNGAARIGCIAYLKDIVNTTGGEDLLREVLNVVMVWQGKKSSLLKKMLKGIAEFIVIAKKQHNFNTGVLKTKLMLKDPQEILDNSKVMDIPEQLVKIYNEELPADKRLNRKNFLK